MRKNNVVILDNGHGIQTLGKRSPNGEFLEYKWCREFVKLLKSELEQYGYSVFPIVTSDNDVSLSTRAEMANDICLQFGLLNCIFISIHNNAAGDGKKWYNATGWEAFTSPGRTRSDKLADLLYEEIELQNIKVRKDKSDGDSDKEEKFTVLTKTLCPAVLTENMFMDSKKDVEFLTSEEGIKKLLNGHVIGIRRYFEDFNGTHDSWIENNLYKNELC